ncbi:L-threonine 3-dehydrogenase, partial [Vibrio parahaemolyticus VPTS-2010_2]
MWYRRTHL